ncbi:hypothetical protein HMPREF9413_3581 [Paenibacillus sp. HGF7]|nr:hypothetical protein HMPREF9413_3581 [Paenibacillus sp. HGF7]
MQKNKASLYFLTFTVYDGERMGMAANSKRDCSIGAEE